MKIEEAILYVLAERNGGPSHGADSGYHQPQETARSKGCFILFKI